MTLARNAITRLQQDAINSTFARRPPPDWNLSLLKKKTNREGTHAHTAICSSSLITSVGQLWNHHRCRAVLQLVWLVHGRTSAVLTAANDDLKKSHTTAHLVNPLLSLLCQSDNFASTRKSSSAGSSAATRHRAYHGCATLSRLAARICTLFVQILHHKQSLARRSTAAAVLSRQARKSPCAHAITHPYRHRRLTRSHNKKNLIYHAHTIDSSWWSCFVLIHLCVLERLVVVNSNRARIVRAAGHYQSLATQHEKITDDERRNCYCTSQPLQSTRSSIIVLPSAVAAEAEAHSIETLLSLYRRPQ